MGRDQSKTQKQFSPPPTTIKKNKKNKKKTWGEKRTTYQIDNASTANVAFCRNPVINISIL